MKKKEIVQLHAIVRGNVQGVFFRATTKKFADGLGLVGTVQNLDDGSVEIVAQGPLEDINVLFLLLTGSSGTGRIDSIEKEVAPSDITFSGFSVLF